MNIFKEKAKIRERVAHITDSKDREEKLIQIAVEDRIEAEQKGEEKVADANQKGEEKVAVANQKIGRLETERVSHNFSHISSNRSLKRSERIR